MYVTEYTKEQKKNVIRGAPKGLSIETVACSMRIWNNEKRNWLENRVFNEFFKLLQNEWWNNNAFDDAKILQRLGKCTHSISFHSKLIVLLLFYFCMNMCAEYVLLLIKVLSRSIEFDCSSFLICTIYAVIWD